MNSSKNIRTCLILPFKGNESRISPLSMFALDFWYATFTKLRNSLLFLMCWEFLKILNKYWTLGNAFLESTKIIIWFSPLSLVNCTDRLFLTEIFFYSWINTTWSWFIYLIYCWTWIDKILFISAYLSKHNSFLIMFLSALKSRVYDSHTINWLEILRIFTIHRWTGLQIGKLFSWLSSALTD